MNIKPVTSLPMEKMEELGKLSSDCYSANFHEGLDNWISKVLARKTLSMYAEENGEIIGYIVAFPYDSSLEVPLRDKIEESIDENCIYIHDVGVKMEHRNKGVAKKLIESVFDKSKDSGLKFVLMSVQDTVEFWERFGFYIISKNIYGGVRAYKMEKKSIT